MCLPDEERIIRSLRQLKQESPPPRQEWKRVGAERLVRKASTVQRRKKVWGTLVYTSTLAATVLMGVWFGSGLEQQSPTAAEQQNDYLTFASPKIAVNDQMQPRVEGQTEADGQRERVSVPEPMPNEQGADTGSTPPSNQAMSIARSAETASGSAAIPKTTLEEEAERFLRSKLGEKSSEYQLDRAHSRLSEGYVAFRRILHGIPLRQHSAAVKVNPASGEKKLLLYPHAEEFPDISNTPETAVIDKTKAAQELATALRLVYAAKEQQPLQYVLAPHLFVYAQTGKMPVEGKEKDTVAAVKARGERLVIKDRREAAKIMRDEFGIDVTGEPYMGIDSQSITYHWQQGGKPIATLRTGEDGRFYEYTLTGAAGLAKNPVSSLRQAQEIALGQLEKYLPSQVEEVVLESVSLDAGRASFTVLPMHHGIPVIDLPYEITVEMESGLVTKMAGDFSKGSFRLPDPAEAIPPAEAVAHFVRAVPLELVYLTENGGDLTLVYQAQAGSQKQVAIDAKTGKIVD